MIPTRVDSSSLVLNGTIQLSAEIPLESVESTQKLNFPDSVSSSNNGVDSTSATSSNSAASNNIGTQLQGIVSQLANGIDTTKKQSIYIVQN
jgi:hypothetical protein